MKFSKYVLIILILCVGISLACSFSGATNTLAQETKKPGETTAQEPIKSTIGKVGDTISQGGYIITVVNAETATSYGEIDKPESGNIFVGVEIIIESAADTGVSVNPYFCTLTDGDARSYNPSFVGNDPLLSSQNDLPKGEKMRGWVTFEVPETAKDFLFLYEPISFTDDVRILFGLGF
jgi:hypothetical protein